MNIIRSESDVNTLIVSVDDNEALHATSVDGFAAFVESKVADAHPELVRNGILAVNLQYDFPEQLKQRYASGLESSPEFPDVEEPSSRGFSGRRNLLKMAAAVLVGAPLIGRQRSASAAICGRSDGKCQFPRQCAL